MAALATLAGCTSASSGALATSVQERGMHAGQAFADPPDVPSTVDPTVTLDAAAGHLDIGGRQVEGRSYNGAFVAPTLHLTPGAETALRLVNHLGVATNLHFHGLHVSPGADSDNSFLCIAPGHTFTYRLALPADHPQGTFWYHSHATGTACPAMSDTSTMSGATSAMSGTSGTDAGSGDVESQIFSGLSGALIVGDVRNLLPAALQHVRAHTLVLKDAQIDRSGRIIQNSINSSAPTVRLVNGQVRPVLAVNPGETQLWRLVNAGADIFYQLRLEGWRFTVIAQDGQPAVRVTTADRLLLPPAKRYDVLVTAPVQPGRSWLRTLPYSNGPQGDSYPDVRLLQVKTSGAQQKPTSMNSDSLRTAPPDLAGAVVAQRRTLTLSENGAGTRFFINNAQFAMNASVFGIPARLGTVEEWTILNASGEDHPFHLHTDAFQVVSIGGVTQTDAGRQDTLVVPHAVNGKPGQVVIRIRFSDYTGKVMFHCHIAAHEDNGMMSYVNVGA